MKFNNKKTEIDGILFDSQLESKYYEYLLALRGRGIVLEIETQPVFLLLPSFRKDKRTIRKIVYKADFRVTYSDGRQEIVDVKTQATMTKEFRIKWKLFDYYYPDLELKLLTLEGSEWVELSKKKERATQAKRGVKNGKRKGKAHASLPKRRKSLSRSLWNV